MQKEIIKTTALIVLLSGWFSCTTDTGVSDSRKEFQPLNPGTELSSLAIDSNILSFALPYIVESSVQEHPPEPNYGGPNAFRPTVWTIGLAMAEGTDITKLAPIITLGPRATLKEIGYIIDGQVFEEQVDYTGIAKFGPLNFTHQISFMVFDLDNPSGPPVTYIVLAYVKGGAAPCINCS